MGGGVVSDSSAGFWYSIPPMELPCLALIQGEEVSLTTAYMPCSVVIHRRPALIWLQTVGVDVGRQKGSGEDELGQEEGGENVVGMQHK